MIEPGEYDVVFGGEVVGKAELDENGKIISASLSSTGLKEVAPNYDPTAGLSIAEVPEGPYIEAWERQNPDAPRSYIEAFESKKGTFDR